MVALAVFMAAATVAVCTINELVIRDPDDDVVGPAYIRFPLILLAAFLVDVVPRAIARSRRLDSTFREQWHEVMHERWRAGQIRFLVTGLIGWYVCYSAFRNLKNAVPFVNGNLWDSTMAKIDRALWFGHDPGVTLHHWFGIGAAAQFFSLIYIAWIAFIPLVLMWALVWTRKHALSAWIVTAIAVVWALGAITYFAFPTLGPIYSSPQDFTALQHTSVTTLQENMIDVRERVLRNPDTAALQSIAAFASLHVGLTMTMCLLFEFAGLRRLVRWSAWVFLGLTVLATMYLGWHFFVDVLGGIAIGAVAVWVAAMGTGNHVGWRPRLVEDPAPVDAPAVQHA